MRCPEQVGSTQIFVPTYTSDLRWGDEKISKWHLQIALGKLHTPIHVEREFLIESHTIAPCVCGIEVIKELIKTSHLGRLKSLVRDQCSFQNPEGRSAHRCVRPWMPHNPELRVDLVGIFCSRTLRVEDVATGTKCEGYVFQERKIGIHVKIDVGGISRQDIHSSLRPRPNG